METYSENLVWMDLEMTGLDPEVGEYLNKQKLYLNYSVLAHFINFFI